MVFCYINRTVCTFNQSSDIFFTKVRALVRPLWHKGMDIFTFTYHKNHKDIGTFAKTRPFFKEWAHRVVIKVCEIYFLSKYDLIYILCKPLALPIRLCKKICKIFNDLGYNQEKQQIRNSSSYLYVAKISAQFCKFSKLTLQILLPHVMSFQTKYNLSKSIGRKWVK